MISSLVTTSGPLSPTNIPPSAYPFLPIAPPGVKVFALDPTPDSPRKYEVSPAEAPFATSTLLLRCPPIFNAVLLATPSLSPPPVNCIFLIMPICAAPIAPIIAAKGGPNIPAWANTKVMAVAVLIIAEAIFIFFSCSKAFFCISNFLASIFFILAREPALLPSSFFSAAIC